MSTTQILAVRILNESPDPKLVTELRLHIDDPKVTGLIVDSMLFSLRVSMTEFESVSAAMDRLEAMAEQDEEVACCLMAHLWSASSQVEGSFDVSDAIDLWITNTGTPLVISQLRFLCDSAAEEETRKHFRSMIRM